MQTGFSCTREHLHRRLAFRYAKVHGETAHIAVVTGAGAKEDCAHTVPRMVGKKIKNGFGATETSMEPTVDKMGNRVDSTVIK